ncbi:hypothetical protein TcCL_ESM04027 [Trypanosoma cruzi]|nr:hypothetical protein TcCL_ESM04027 [Trypanosoma cruzi]
MHALDGGMGGGVKGERRGAYRRLQRVADSGGVGTNDKNKENDNNNNNETKATKQQQHSSLAHSFRSPPNGRRGFAGKKVLVLSYETPVPCGVKEGPRGCLILCERAFGVTVIAWRNGNQSRRFVWR